MVDEGYNLTKSGTVEFTFGDQKQVLERPTLGQYRRLIERLNDMRRELGGDDPPVDADDKEAVLEAARKIDVNKQFDGVVEWLTFVFETLCEQPLPSEDELPSWMINPSIITDLITQWQKVPTRRGGN